MDAMPGARSERQNNEQRMNGVGKFLFILFCCSAVNTVSGQYEDSPLKGKKWATLSVGVNSADFLCWQGMGTFSSRGETVLTQLRLGYSQELLIASNDSCTEKRNRLSEIGLLWGDGWGGKKWYVTAAVGFGMNVRMYCDHGQYENRYLTAVTLGVPAQIELGLMINKNIGVNMVGVGNWNFRAPYFGGHLGFVYRFK